MVILLVHDVISSFHRKMFIPKKLPALTRDANFVERPQGLVPGVSGDVVSEADGCERDKAVIKGIQEVPSGLQLSEYEGGEHDEQGHGDDAHGGQVEHADVEGLLTGNVAFKWLGYIYGIHFLSNILS